MNIKTLLPCIFFTSFTLFANEAIANDDSKLCYEGYCFTPTIEGFLESLPSRIDYEFLGNQNIKSVNIKRPVEINNQAFNVRYSRIYKSVLASQSLSYTYKFTPRNATTCQERYHKILKPLNITHGPFKSDKPVKKPIDNASRIPLKRVSKIMGSPDGPNYLQTLNSDRTYRNNVSVAQIAPDITMQVNSTEWDYDASKSDKIPSCKLVVIFGKKLR